MSQFSKFRPDIEGLRAIAVLLVVACHAGVPWLQGGFIGVDVFFVISGYLITRLMYAEHTQSGRLDLRRFYQRRIRRLLPAFAAMLLVVMVGVRVLYSPLDQPNLLNSALSAVLYVSNLYFATGATNYWGPDAKLDPLLHTWSLGVEEQFYLVWPLLLITLMWLQRRARPALVWGSAALLVLVSWGMAVLLSYTHQPFAFFVPLTRLWEFGVGAALAITEVRRFARAPAVPWPAWRASALSVTGLLMLLAGAVLYSDATPFPGWAVLLPVLGTLAVIAANTGHASNFGAGLLAVAPLQALGRLSYGWYLWHWPLLVFGKVLWPESTVWVLLALVLGSLLVAALSYRLIENPVRHAPVFRQPTFAWGLALVMPLILVGALWGLKQSAQAREQQEPYSRLAAARGDMPGIYPAGCDRSFWDALVVKCVGGNEHGQKVAVLLGDSIAGQWFSAFHLVMEEAGWKLIVLTKSSCPIPAVPYVYRRIGRIYYECDQWRADALREIAVLKPDLVVVSSSEGYPLTAAQWQNGTRPVVDALSRAAKAVVILRDSPRPGVDVPACLARKAWQPALFSGSCSYEAEQGLSAAMKLMYQRIAAQYRNVTYVEMTSAVCGGDGLHCDAAYGNSVKYRDVQHLADSFVRSLAPALKKELIEKQVMPRF